MDRALATSRIEAAVSDQERPFDKRWVRLMAELSEECARANIHTHIAFIATAITARATDTSVDLTAVKPTHSASKSSAYSARILSETVVVPMANLYDINLGVTGRQPLNNQPYFRMRHLGDETPIHQRSRVAFAMVQRIVSLLQKANADEAYEALRAFIHVRQSYRISYEGLEDGQLTFDALAPAISELIREDSESGKRAQAAVAALYDAAFDPENVTSGRINDPSRDLPGDVQVAGKVTRCSTSVEVRDKPVSISDVTAFVRACARNDIPIAVIVAISGSQAKITDAELITAIGRYPVPTTIVYSIADLISHLWPVSRKTKSHFTADVIQQLHHRLKEVEASEKSIRSLNRLLRSSR
jgi:hypothetical protein